MKKFVLTLFVIIFLTSCDTKPPTDPNKFVLKTGEVFVEINFSQNSNLNAEKIVQLEDFANVSCTPCLISNKIIESISRNSELGRRVNVIKFPTNFPSPVDPMYLTAKPFCDYRMSFYQILFAPTIIVDGILRPVPTDSNQIKQAIEQRLQTATNFSIAITSVVENKGLKIIMNIETSNINSTELENLKLRVALVEKEINFSTPPGSNGETKFYDVLRTLLPSNDGISLSELKGIHSFLFENVIDSTWNLENLKPIGFIQNNDTKEIVQSSVYQ
ncbi:MAG: Omp28-related outer membrane protein [Ignavibacterium sp.]|nr:Omp28-related outer membrane protein [Ignavibacterium sp.]